MFTNVFIYIYIYREREREREREKSLEEYKFLSYTITTGHEFKKKNQNITTLFNIIFVNKYYIIINKRYALY